MQPRATPADKSSVYAYDNSDVLEENVQHQEAVGSLLYLATGTRLDISFAVNVVSQGLNKPAKRHWEMVKRILRYLKGTAEVGITYKHGYDPGVLIAYSDADYADDILTSRSTSGVVCLHLDGPVSWSCKKQKFIAVSTTEAEYIAASEAAKSIIWQARLFGEITTLTAVPLLRIDNTSAVKLVQSPVYHQR